MTAGGSVARATALSTAATFVGYSSTLIQQLVLARALGISADVDALAAALGWAVAATGVVGWTLASLVVPPYIEARSRDPLEARRLSRTSSALAIAGGGSLALGTFFAAGPLAAALLPGSESSSVSALTVLLRISAPLHLVWTFWILTAAIANARRRFVGAGIVTVVPSIIVVMTVAAFPSVEATMVAYVIGMAAQVVVLTAFGRDWRSDIIPRLTRPELDRLRTGAVPFALTFLLQSAAFIVARSAASLGGAGDVAALDYAVRLTLAGESVLLTGALAVALTVWSEDRATGADRLPLSGAIAVTTGLGLAIIAVVIVMATPIVSLLFVGGRFGDADVGLVALALTWIAPGIAARMVLHLVMRVLLARRAAWPLAAASAVAAVVAIVGAPVGQAMLGLAGVGLGYSVAWAASALVAFAAAKRTT